MNIFITGGTGFIGRHLIKYLVKNGHDVTINIHKSDIVLPVENIKTYSFINNNLAVNIDYFKIEKFDGIIHLATFYLTEHKPQDITELTESNLTFATQVLECACKAKIKWFINTGTSWQNYRNFEYAPVNLYAATKQAFEDIAKFYVITNQIKFSTIKLFDTYGPGDNRPKFFNLWTRISKTGESLEMSPGEQIIDIVHVVDVVRAYLLLATYLNDISNLIPNGAVYVLKAQKRYKLKELAKMFEKITGRKLNIKWGQKPYRINEVMIPYENGEPLSGWEPQYSIEQGILEAYTAIKD